MVKRPKDKGTAEETAIVNDWNFHFEGEIARRMPAGALYDVFVDGQPGGIDVLATRADRGERLVTLRHSDFMRLWERAYRRPCLYIESKRYAKFALHTIFFSKFGKR
jgi:hypothetical protein